jgi:hypothetical protein
MINVGPDFLIKTQHIRSATFCFKRCSKITEKQPQRGSCISTEMNADIDPINDNLEIVLAGCVDEYYNMLVNLGLGHLIIESPERKRKIRNFTNECIS